MQTKHVMPKQCVVLVEPDVMLADTYHKALARAGYEVAHARTAQSAIDVIDGWTPDCIILEMQLPAHNGVEFLYELRSYIEWQRVPVVINTYTPRSEFVRMHDALQTLGIAEVLYKPQTTLRRLVAAVREAISEQKVNTVSHGVES